MKYIYALPPFPRLEFSLPPKYIAPFPHKYFVPVLSGQKPSDLFSISFFF
uniref:Uncharacterized protein n=1 Tax=Octopus bimaculoides TaxID=37653 RepID=A0A0L8GFE2_OCTBM